MSTLFDRIGKNTNIRSPTKFELTDVNINYINLCDKSKDNLIFTLGKTAKKLVRDEELQVDKILLNTDRTGMAVIKVMHQLLLPVFSYE